MTVIRQFSNTVANRLKNNHMFEYWECTAAREFINTYASDQAQPDCSIQKEFWTETDVAQPVNTCKVSMYIVCIHV